MELQGYEWNTQGLPCAISFLKGGFVRLTYGGEGVLQTASLPEWLPMQTERDEALVRLTAEGFSAEIRGDRVRIVCNGHAECNILGTGRAEGVTTVKFSEPRSARIYGLGQDPSARIDHNGQERRMWNQWGGHERSGNLGIGFFASTAGHGMLLNTTLDARFCFNESEPQPLDPLGEAMVPSLWGRCPELAADSACVQVRGPVDVVLFFGTVEEQLKAYYQLTGLPGLLPRWAYGFLQCKNRYLNERDLFHTAETFREKNIPCDGLIIDWLWFREFGDLEWREDDWPHPGEMLRTLHEQGFHVLSAQHPFISENGKYYREYEAHSCLNRVPETKRVTWDHSNPEARAVWWSKTKKLREQGLDGYWTDMGELEEHFEGTKSFLGGRNETHNAYSAFWAQGLYEGQRRDYGSRPVMLSRSGCAGIQKYGTAVWSGDINASWQVLRDQVRLAQIMSLSGIPWWCTDIGGFLTGEEFSPELYIRWMEWGVFCGVFRTHGTRPGNEPWSFGVQTEPVVRRLITLRCRLLPYVYSEAMKTALCGVPMIRPMSVAFPGDPAAVCEDEYMFGSALLIAPVTEPGARSREVLLPAGSWCHLFSGKVYDGGLYRVAAPLGEPPVFVRADTLLPVYTEIGRNAEECGGLELLRVPGTDAEYVLYSDDGEGFGYESGAYAATRFTGSGAVICAEPVCGECPAFTARNFEEKPEKPFFADVQPDRRTALVRVTFRLPGTYGLEIEPQDGFVVTGCPGSEITDEIYENRCFPRYAVKRQLRENETALFRLADLREFRSPGPYAVRITVTDESGERREETLRWGNACLSDPQILGCLPAGAVFEGESPLSDPERLCYTASGQRYFWLRDRSFADNCFGYVDFRRFDPSRDGEAMYGEAWAKYRIRSGETQSGFLHLRYDAPAEVFLNGMMICRGESKNGRSGAVRLELPAGASTLLVHSRCSVERPYSGNEFGFSLSLEGFREIFVG